jgi:hypothetical protein
LRITIGHVIDQLRCGFLSIPVEKHVEGLLTSLAETGSAFDTTADGRDAAPFAKTDLIEM